ncbi:MAG: hypothetical protein AAF975_07325, partial [Spirochaetota bacterium]
MGVILCCGFDEDLYPMVRVEGEFDPNIAIVTLKPEDLPLTLAEIAERAAEPEESFGLGSKQNSAEQSSPQELPSEYRYVIFSGNRSSLNAVMKGFKKAYKPPAASVIYAMLTATAKKWTLQFYLRELA